MGPYLKNTVVRIPSLGDTVSTSSSCIIRITSRTTLLKLPLSKQSVYRVYLQSIGKGLHTGATLECLHTVCMMASLHPHSWSLLQVNLPQSVYPRASQELEATTQSGKNHIQMTRWVVARISGESPVTQFSY